MSRSHPLHRVAREMSTEHPGCEARATYETADRRWTLSWIDGPTIAAVRTRTAGKQVDLQRHYRYRALAVAAVTLSLSGELEGVDRYDRWGLGDALTDHLAKITDPHTIGGRIGALADALLEHLPDRVEAADVALAVREHGLARLLRQPSTDASDTSEDSLVMSPAEYLTSRYAASGRDSLDWNARLATAPAAGLVAAAIADENLDQAGHLAVLALLGQMRTEIERLEDAALSRAHTAGASWSRIGAALGITKQSAHARASRRAAGRPTRSSGQS